MPAPDARSRQHWPALAGLLVLAAVCRWIGLQSFPFEQDELYTLHESTYLFASQLPPGIEARPLFYLIQHVVLLLAPPTPGWLRLLPFLFGVAGVWLTWHLGRRWFGPVAGAVAAGLVAISPWHLHASGFSRYYSLLYLLAACVFLLLPRAYDSDRRRDYVLALVPLLLGSATHPSFVFPMVGAVLAVTLVTADGRWGFRWPSRNGWFALWGPYGLALLLGFLALQLTDNTAAVRNLGGRGTMATLRLIPAMVQWMTPVTFAAAALGALALLLVPSRPDARRAAAMTFLGVATVFGGLLAVSTFSDVYADYGMAMLPLVFVAAGGLVQLAADRSTLPPWGVAATAGAVLAAGILPSTVSHLSDGTRFDYRPAFGIIAAENPQLAVITYPKILQEYYAPGLRGIPLRMNPRLMDSILAVEGEAWAVISVQRYGIVRDDRGLLAQWLSLNCRLRASHQRPRLDYRNYRVDLYRCQAPSPTSRPAGTHSRGLAGSFVPVIGDDWRSYRDVPEMLATRFWFVPNEESFRLADHVALVPDPTFGRVARITQPADSRPKSRGGFTPQLRRKLPTPLDDVWFRFRVKFSPGWTTRGPYPRGAANSYKLAFLLWHNSDGRAQIEFTNTDGYDLGVHLPGGRCSSLRLPGSQDFGAVTTEWTGAEWWEFVMHYERISPTVMRQSWWRRTLTRSGAIVANPFTFLGVERTCDTTPRVRGIALGVNKNKATPATQYIYWGPWEVVDGSVYADPFGLPHVN